MLFPCVKHWFLFLKNVWLSWAIEITVIGRSTSSDENLTSGKSAGRGVVLYLTVVDSCQTIAVGQWAQSQNFFALSEKAYTRIDFMAYLYESLISCEGHHQNWKLYHCRFSMLPNRYFLNSQIILSLLLSLNSL